MAPDGARICFQDLAISRGYARPAEVRYDVEASDGLGKRIVNYQQEATGPAACLPIGGADRGTRVSRRPDPCSVRRRGGTRGRPLRQGDPRAPALARQPRVGSWSSAWSGTNDRWRGASRASGRGRGAPAGARRSLRRCQPRNGPPIRAAESGWTAERRRSHRPARQVARGALAVPRLATKAVLWPIVETTDVLEYHHVVDWGRALLTTDDGRVGVRPELQYSTSFVPTGGARFFYRRLPGAGSEIMTRFRTAGPAATLGELGVRGPDWLGLSLLADLELCAMIACTPESVRTQTRSWRPPDRAARATDSKVWAPSCSGRGACPGRLIARLRGGVDHRDYHATNVVGGPSVAELYGLPADACAARGLSNPCVDESQMPGFYRGLRLARAGGGLVLDLRNPARDGGGFSVARGRHLRSRAGRRPQPSRDVHGGGGRWRGRQRPPVPHPRPRHPGGPVGLGADPIRRARDPIRHDRHAWLSRRAAA